MAEKDTSNGATLWQAINASQIGFEPALTIPDRLVQPDSWAGHLPFASWIVAMTKPRRIVELGVHTGNSFCTFAQAVKKYNLDTDCFGIDHWFGDSQAGNYGEEVYSDLKAWHDPRFGHFSKLLRMSFLDGRSYVEDGSVDLLHIDGLHTYEAVREDFETWIPKMSDRCVVLFHDTAVYQADFGVWRYFREIKEKYPTFEFRHSNGLGVAYTGKRPLTDLDPLFALLFDSNRNDDTTGLISRYFSLLGDAHIRAVRLDDKQKWGSELRQRLQEISLELENATNAVSSLLLERDSLMPKATNWDQLAVNTGGALSLDLAQISKALNLLYNSGNPQALRDRDVLRREFHHLIETGTLVPTPDRPVTQLHVLLSKFKQRLVDKSVRSDRNQESFQSDPPAIEFDEEVEAVRGSGLFNKDFYALTGEAEAAGQDPLEHYLQIGEKLNKAPSEQFDPDYYARRNPDVAKSGFGLLRHYVLVGKAEGRQCVTPAKRVDFSFVKKNGRPRILLPIEPGMSQNSRALAVSITRQMAQTHDVMLLADERDTQADLFRPIVAATIVFPEEPDIDSIDRNEVLASIVNQCQPDFGVALSVHGGRNTRGLCAAGLGMVQFVDAYASEIFPTSQANQFLPWAHRLLFPSKSVAVSFTKEHLYVSRRQTDILPPPACGDRQALAILEKPEIGRDLNATFRSGAGDTSLLVMGSGPLEPGSGVETFIALAKQCGSENRDGRPLRFVWVTNEQRDPNATAYGRLLQEQIRRVGIADYCSLVAVDSGIEAASQFADVYALTAPLDAICQQALSAIRNGVPVVCFEGASTLADVLSADQNASDLVAKYLDVEALAEIVLSLSANEELYSRLKKSCAEMNTGVFNLDKFADELIATGLRAKNDACVVSADSAVIRAADPPAFSDALFGGIWSTDDYPQDYLHTYLLRRRVSRFVSKFTPPDLRRPLAGFNPSIYLEDAMDPDSEEDPLAAWIKAGRPQGRWTHPVIRLEETKPVPSRTKTLLHGHFYYVDLIDEFLEKFQVNRSPVDLVLTVPNEEKKEAAEKSLSRFSLPGTAMVEIVPNVGRDVAPFLTGLKEDFLAQYDVIGHIHGKKSPHISAGSGSEWRTFLWEHVVGGQTAAIDACLEAFDADPGLGLIFPEDQYLTSWDINFEMSSELADRMGRSQPLPNAFEWPVGNMFWARRAALEPLFALKLDWEDYPDEPLPGDGTLLHALERIIPFAVEQAGFNYAVTHFAKVLR